MNVWPNECAPASRRYAPASGAGVPEHVVSAGTTLGWLWVSLGPLIAFLDRA